MFQLPCLRYRSDRLRLGELPLPLLPLLGVAAGVPVRPVHPPVESYVLDAALRHASDMSERNALLASHAHYAQGMLDASAVAQRAAECRERLVAENATAMLNAAVGNVVLQAASEVQTQRARYEHEQQELRDALTRQQVAECNTKVEVDAALAQRNQEMSLLKECAAHEVTHYQKQLSSAQDRVKFRLSLGFLCGKCVSYIAHGAASVP